MASDAQRTLHPTEAILQAILHPADRQTQEALAAALRQLARGEPREVYSRISQSLDEVSQRLASLLAETLLAAELTGRARVAARLPALSPQPHQQAAPPAPDLLTLLEAQLAAGDVRWRRQLLEALAPEVRAALMRRGSKLEPDDYLERAAEDPYLGEIEYHYPAVAAGVKALQEKRLLSYQEYREMAYRARGQAHAVVGNLSASARSALIEALAENVSAGADLRKFREEAEKAVGVGVLSEREVELAFRDGANRAYAEGQDAVLADPIVGDSFPYVETMPIRDSRLSKICEAAAEGGIGRSAVYRRDDPVWARLRPPRHPNCRCGQNPLTLREAARRGIPEAVKWSKSGKPPTSPAWVAMPAEALKAGL
jgi:SPP1 gp7 family putative phage head morphogenesis protein